MQEKIVARVSLAKLLTEIQSLKQRSLVEKTQTGFTLQPVVMDFFTERFVETIEEEIITKKLNLFISHRLLNNQDEDYIRMSQIKFCLQPLVQRLSRRFSPLNKLESHLQKMLLTLQEDTDKIFGYGLDNLGNILHQLASLQVKA